MKVVINRCYGGFGLSPLAQREYLARKGKEAFFYVEDRESKMGERDLIRVSPKEAEKAFISHTMTRDLGKRVTPDSEHEDADWYYGDIDRADKDLVAVVEKLGDKANGKYANLRVVEIPDGVAYEIDEYDGSESIHEVHRSWA